MKKVTSCPQRPSAGADNNKTSTFISSVQCKINNQKNNKLNKICSFVKYSFCIFFFIFLEFHLYWTGSVAETIWHFNTCRTFKYNLLERWLKLDSFIQFIISTLLWIILQFQLHDMYKIQTFLPIKINFKSRMYN